MTNGARQMPAHVDAAYKDAVDNIIFLKRQQWVATNYAILVYAAIFVISAMYFSRTDFARNTLGIVALVKQDLTEPKQRRHKHQRPWPGCARHGPWPSPDCCLLGGAAVEHPRLDEIYVRFTGERHRSPTSRIARRS